MCIKSTQEVPHDSLTVYAAPSEWEKDSNIASELRCLVFQQRGRGGKSEKGALRSKVVLFDSGLTQVLCWLASPWSPRSVTEDKVTSQSSQRRNSEHESKEIRTGAPPHPRSAPPCGRHQDTARPWTLAYRWQPEMQWANDPLGGEIWGE